VEPFLEELLGEREKKGEQDQKTLLAPQDLCPRKSLNTLHMITNKTTERSTKELIIYMHDLLYLL